LLECLYIYFFLEARSWCTLIVSLHDGCIMVKFNNAVFELVVLYKNLENFDQYIDFWM